MELILLGKRKRNKVDQLELFVTAPPVEEMPLDFWKQHHGSFPQLAPIAPMVKDFYAIPATSASSEHCFSKAHALLPYTRNCLSPNRIKEQMLLDSWYHFFDQKDEMTK